MVYSRLIKKVPGAVASGFLELQLYLSGGVRDVTLIGSLDGANGALFSDHAVSTPPMFRCRLLQAVRLGARVHLAGAEVGSAGRSCAPTAASAACCPGRHR